MALRLLPYRSVTVGRVVLRLAGRRGCLAVLSWPDQASSLGAVLGQLPGSMPRWGRNA
jgi:hypothetical protein